MSKLSIVAPAMALLACFQPDSSSLGVSPMKPTSPLVVPASLNSLPGPPDIAAARAAEEAAMEPILRGAEGAYRESFRAELLNGGPPRADGRRVASRLEGTTPESQARVERFYAAHEHRIREELRESAIAKAQQSGGVTVAVALGDPPGGSGAVIVRGPKEFYDVILLPTVATIETLADAFATLAEIRKCYGDAADFAQDVAIAVSAVPRPTSNGRQLASLTRILHLAQTAPLARLEGVGSVRLTHIFSEHLARLDR
jgi:hypothetical protein